MKFKNISKISNITTVLLLCITLTCQAENKILNLKITHNDASISVTPQIDFITSNEIKEAIDNGIRIQLIAKAEIYQPVDWWFDKIIDNQHIQLEFSYSILGKYYVVKNKATEQRIGNINYNKLWDSFGSLIRFEFPKPLNNSKVKLRIVLDKGALPTAMQLPVLFNDNWDIDTQWYHQQVTISE